MPQEQGESRFLGSLLEEKMLYFWKLHKLRGSPLSKIVLFLFSTATVPNGITDNTAKLYIEIIVWLTSV